MPPKRKSAATKSNAKQRKVKVEPEEDNVKSTIEALKAAPTVKAKAKIDEHCPLSNTSAEIHEDYDCMLNQTNIGNNNNKFYIIQLIELNGSYYCWNRWGRVGEVGQSKLGSPVALNVAVKDFEKKFKDKTKNDWANKDSFVAHPGKYTMIEVQQGYEEATIVKNDTVDGGTIVNKKVKHCTLDKPTQELVTLLFSHDMFKEQMQTMNLDVKKMPLGKLSKQQIAKGFDALDEIEAALKPSPNRKQLEELSSKFYTIIPHYFGRNRPPVIDTSEVIQAKRDMLLVLADIELAQSLQAEKEQKIKTEVIEEVPHPLDEDYNVLKCDLQLLAPNSEEFQMIKKYVDATGSSYRPVKIIHVWKLNRDGEGSRFKSHDNIENRRLLWHGTNIAVVAAILKTGLRIMPHSGGRVGCGIYFASENSKSAGYVGFTSKSIGVMFLTEVALGKEHYIFQDNSRLKSAPKGFDSVVARGNTEPDCSQDKEFILEGKKVMVPQGKPVNINVQSSFSQSEYVIYKESQARLRYLLQVKY
ncbi:protein mono-ADP-ribosyltransferase PARP3 [Hemiscyllium ocellatum]|uniref:protein mono-ADP-ribosyltransferase PARP3 n=1 Tax=Hemiscyllium ocellatum TaxID=170820 RepID=UPI00296773A8|nr:protein mono-ADP-ribosyltransferase PARP3 [Hemiscyllium ocellatum]XP_060691758.1 protein mono-ADP-ribosyltransferase PARP3 [Hemiscyllium ocellatum]